MKNGRTLDIFYFKKNHNPSGTALVYEAVCLRMKQSCALFFTVHCLLSTVLSTFQCPISTINCPPSSVNCHLFTVNCLQPTVLKSTVHCPLSSVHSYDVLDQIIAISLYQCLYFDYVTLCMILLGAKDLLPRLALRLARSFFPPGACTVSAAAHALVASTRTGPIHT